MLCLWPFRHVSVDQRGRIRPCCSWRFEEWEDHYGENDIINFNDSSIQDYIDSKFLSVLQSNMINDQFPKGGCSDCINEVKSGRDTLFEAGNRRYAMSNSFRIHDMEIKFGNKCNLGCVMCGPACSSLLESESAENFDTIESYGFEATKEKLYSGQTPWFEREEKMQELAKFASNARLIRFTGGEPTVNGYLRKFLSYLREYTTNIDLKLTTNGFKVPQSLLDSVKDFQSVWFDFSVDGVGKVNEFVRWPSKWSNICDNIKKCNELTNSAVSVKTTLHAMNVHNIGEIADWIDHNHDIFEWDINLVWEPEYLRPYLCSEESKQVYHDTCAKYPTKDHKCSVVHSVKKAIDNSSVEQDKLDMLNEKLTKYLTMLGSIRNLDWQQHIRI